VALTFRLKGIPDEFTFDMAKLAQEHPTLNKLRNEMLSKSRNDANAVDTELAFRFFDALNRFGEGYVKEMSSTLQRIFQTRDDLSNIYGDAVAGKPVSSEAVKSKFDALAADMAKLKSPEKALSEAGTIELPPKEQPTTMEPEQLGIDLPSDADLGAMLDDIESTAEVPRVKGGKIDGKTVPRTPRDPAKREAWFARRRGRLNIWDLVQRTGESFRMALDRVRTVIGTKISNHPVVRDVWNAALQKTLNGRPLESITRDEMLGKGEYEGKGLYDRTRDQFWKDVRENAAARAVFENAGLKFGDQPAPNLEVTVNDVPGNEIKVSLDHVEEKAQGENWKKAVSADNLQFEFLSPNSFREAVQVRLKLRSPN
jgi:hypothetical protein